MSRIVIVVSVSKKYSDIADVFFELFSKNYSNCSFDVIINYADGYIFKDYGYISYCGNKDDSLTQNIENISLKYNYDYYICLLADALICGEINSDDVYKLFSLIEKNDVQYCRISNSPKTNDGIRRINKKNVWLVSFVGFIATKKFISETVSLFKTDLDFEEYYVRISNSIKKDEYYDNMFEECNDTFHIMHSIKNGYWIKDAYNIVINQGIKINQNRMIMPNKERLLWHIKKIARKYIKGNTKIYIKAFFERLGVKFSSKY